MPPNLNTPTCTTFESRAWTKMANWSATRGIAFLLVYLPLKFGSVWHKQQIPRRSNRSLYAKHASYLVPRKTPLCTPYRWVLFSASVSILEVHEAGDFPAKWKKILWNYYGFLVLHTLSLWMQQYMCRVASLTLFDKYDQSIIESFDCSKVRSSFEIWYANLQVIGIQDRSGQISA